MNVQVGELTQLRHSRISTDSHHWIRIENPVRGLYVLKVAWCSQVSVMRMRYASSGPLTKVTDGINVSKSGVKDCINCICKKEKCDLVKSSLSSSFLQEWCNHTHEEFQPPRVTMSKLAFEGDVIYIYSIARTFCAPKSTQNTA